MITGDDVMEMVTQDLQDGGFGSTAEEYADNFEQIGVEHSSVVGALDFLAPMLVESFSDRGEEDDLHGIARLGLTSGFEMGYRLALKNMAAAHE